VTVYARLVGQKVVVHSERNGDWAVGVQLLLDCIDTVNGVRGDCLVLVTALSDAAVATAAL